MPAVRRFSTFFLVFPCLIVLQSLATSADSRFSVEKANAYIEQNKNTVVGIYREKYHLMAPIGWINDPNGFIYFRGEYHLFYQFNPYASHWGSMHWGHAKSKDLVHWEDLPVTLAPDQSYDTDGIFSGSAIEKDGKLYVMYTGYYSNIQVQCIAVSEDGISFEKIAQNPVLGTADLPSNAQPEDFRDPKLFKHGDLYYVVLVSKTISNTSQVLLYESVDLLEWKFKSILLEGNRDQGEMWECPDLFELNGKDVLILSPIKMPRSGNDYHNRNSVVEFIGVVDWEQGKFIVEATKELDHGMDFYATQTLVDDRDRRIMVAWMNMWGRSFPTSDLNHRWTGAMTLPRVLHLKDSHLVQSPIEEVSSLQRNVVEFEGVILNDETKEVDKVSGETGMLHLVANLTGAKAFKIDLRASDKEKTVVSYNTDAGELILDRTNSGITIKGEEEVQVLSRKVQVPLQESRLELQIFLDESSVEVFVSDGMETLTTTIYPTVSPSDKIRFGAVGKVVIETLRFALI